MLIVQICLKYSLKNRSTTKLCFANLDILNIQSWWKLISFTVNSPPRIIYLQPRYSRLPGLQSGQQRRHRTTKSPGDVASSIQTRTTQLQVHLHLDITTCQSHLARAAIVVIITTANRPRHFLIAFHNFFNIIYRNFDYYLILILIYHPSLIKNATSSDQINEDINTPSTVFNSIEDSDKGFCG